MGLLRLASITDVLWPSLCVTLISKYMLTNEFSHHTTVDSISAMSASGSSAVVSSGEINFY